MISTLADGTTRRVTLKDVLYVPQLSYNLFSTSLVQDAGAKFNSHPRTSRSSLLMETSYFAETKGEGPTT